MDSNNINKKIQTPEKIKDKVSELKKDLKSAFSDISEESADIFENTAETISESVEALSDDMIKSAQNSHKQLITAESTYAAEKLKIEEKRKAQSAAIAQAEYQEKLAKASDSGKAAKIMRDETLRLERLADDEYLAQLKDAAEKEKLVRESEFSSLKNSLDLGYITQEEYYSQLAVLRDKYFSEDSSEWSKYTKQINSYQINSLNNLKNYISEAQNDLSKLQNKIENKLSNYSDLYTKRTVTYKKAGENGNDLVFTSVSLNNLNEATEKLREYADTIEAVKKRAELPEGFFDELRNMSIDKGLDFATALLAASDKEFQEYIDSYAKKQAEIARIASELTAAETADTINAISCELEKYYDSIPEGFFKCGKLSGDNFTSAFIDSLSSLSANLNSLFSLSSNGQPSAGSGNSYSSVYNLFSSAQTASEQLREARAASELERMRGGY